MFAPIKHLYCIETIDGEDQNFDQNDFDYTENHTHTYTFNESNNLYIPLYQQWASLSFHM